MNGMPEKDGLERDNDLERFATQLCEALPAMTTDALSRVKSQVDAEIDRVQRRQSTRRWLLGSAVAASVAIAIFAYAASRSSREEAPPTQAMVRDRVKIVQGESTNTADMGKPFIVLEEYRSLFAD